MEKEKSLDKLITVSKVFMDSRVAELRKENQDLRLQLFWKDYTVNSLKEVMRNANNWDRSPHCNCNICAESGRMQPESGRMQHENDDPEIDSERDCAYIPWFEEKIAECGLTFGPMAKCSAYHPHMPNKWKEMHDVDYHLVKVSSDWCSFHYGKKLNNAKTVDDPELKKLENLFQKLYAETTHDLWVEAGRL
jgi:hypothetical protein